MKRLPNGTVPYNALSFPIGLEHLNNVNESAAQTMTPENVPGFLVWAGAILGSNQEFIQYDFYSKFPHAFAGHNPATRQIGDVLRYKGQVYTKPDQQSDNYEWAQPQPLHDLEHRVCLLINSINALTARVAALEGSAVPPTPPTITFIGPQAVSVPVGATYDFPAISGDLTAADEFGVDLTAHIIVTLNELPGTPAPGTTGISAGNGGGTFTITYSVTDGNGNSTTANRIVIFNAPPPYVGVSHNLAGPFTAPTHVTVDRPLPKGTEGFTFQFTFNSVGRTDPLSVDICWFGWGGLGYAENDYYALTSGGTPSYMQLDDGRPYATHEIFTTGYPAYKSLLFDGNDHTVLLTKPAGSPVTATLSIDGTVVSSQTTIGALNASDTTTLFVGCFSDPPRISISQDGSTESIRDIIIRQSS